MTDLYMNIYMVTIIDKDIFLWLLVSHLHLQIKELSNRNSY